MAGVKKYYVGTAGWNVPPDYAALFELEGSHLERYSRVFNAVEINSSFYKIHRPQTFARWAQTVPADFLFSVKLSKHLTHELKLETSLTELKVALEGPLELKEKLGVLLVQLAPSLGFKNEVASKFFEQLRRLYPGFIALEPRHQSWASSEAAQVLYDHGVSLVAADPSRISKVAPSEFEGGGFHYARLHGSPEIYKSKYGGEALKKYADEFISLPHIFPVWCIFDNTTYGHAALNAVELMKNLENVKYDI